MVHDFEHKGVTNDFLVATHDDIALVYNDRCMHSVHSCCGLLSLSHADPLERCTRLSSGACRAVRAGARTRTTT